MDNRPPNVFVSSTMYDLGDLRARLRDFIEGLGWKPVMSEHDPFPIDASESTVQNSLRNVRENADIIVMIVGARYGSVDPGTDKSVTNLEFLEARAVGAPSYVFVDRDVLAQMSVWQSNPDGDFTGIVDTPRVFEFIDSFYSSGEVWTFPFSTADEIVDTLRQQFAYLAQDALGLRHLTQNKDPLLDQLEGKSLRLALRRDDYWEYLLFGTVLEEELDRRTSFRREIEHRLAQASVTHIDLFDLGPWMQDRVQEVTHMADTASAILNNYLPQALGEEGEHGDPIEIAACARRLAQVWEDSAQWTLRCRSVRVDPQAERSVELLSETNANMLDEIWEYGHTFTSRMDEAIRMHSDDDPQVVNMRLTITADTDEFFEEFTRFSNYVDSILP